MAAIMSVSWVQQVPKKVIANHEEAASHALPTCIFGKRERFDFPTKFLIFLGGRTRTRTLDPLIKSQKPRFDIGQLFSQLGKNTRLFVQSVRQRFPNRLAAFAA